MLNFKNRTNELNTQETELERLIAQEMDRQYKRREDQWKKEEVRDFSFLYEKGRQNQVDVRRLWKHGSRYSTQE